MKITNKKYAQALFELVYNKDKKEIDMVLNNFIDFLIKKNHLVKIDKIIKEFNKIWDKNNGIVNATIITAQELDQKTEQSLQNYIKKISAAQRLKLKKIINKDLISGVIIKYGDRILDESLKTKLDNLKIKMLG